MTNLPQEFRRALAAREPLVRASSGARVERSFAEEVAEGLGSTPRWLPTRFIYDEAGSRLFEEITRLPEYYPTRTEAAILRASAQRIRSSTGPATLVELGSGYSVKTEHILRAYDDGNATYVPIDVSESALSAAHLSIERHFPAVRFTGIHGTFGDALPVLNELAPKVLLFLGSTIGNLDEERTARFWTQVIATMGPGDHFLLGVDLVKDVRVLLDAYDDAAGVTARFTKNLFVRMNRELGTTFDLDTLRHEATWNAELEQVEIHARFLAPQRVQVAGRTFEFSADERVLVEISRKYRVKRLERELAACGLTLVESYRDEQDWFALLLLRR